MPIVKTELQQSIAIIDQLLTRRDLLQQGTIPSELGHIILSRGLCENLDRLSGMSHPCKTALLKYLDAYKKKYAQESELDVDYPVAVGWWGWGREQAEIVYGIYEAYRLNMYDLSEYGQARWAFIGGFRAYLAAELIKADPVALIQEAVAKLLNYRDSLEMGVVPSNLGTVLLYIDEASQLHRLIGGTNEQACSALRIYLDEYNAKVFDGRHYNTDFPIEVARSMDADDREGVHMMYTKHKLNMYGLCPYGQARWTYLAGFKEFLTEKTSLNSDSTTLPST